MDDAELIHIEVAYALPEEQVILPLDVPAGTTIESAIRLSGVLSQFPDIDLEKNRVGIFGKLKTNTDEPVSGDRIEIYRPLIADPKEVRRKRAAEGKTMRKGSHSE